MDNIFLKQAEIGEEAQNELCELLDQVDAEAMLSAMAAQLLLRSVEEMASDKYGNHSALLEVIAFYAIPRFGVNTGKCVSHWDFNQCYVLAEKCLTGRMISRRNNKAIEITRNTLSNSLSMYSEVVRGAAYPEQTAQRIIEIQGHFEASFKSNAGISPSKAVEIIFLLIKHAEFAYNSNCDEFHEYGNIHKENYERLKQKRQLDEDEREILETFGDANSAGGFAFFSKLNEVMPKVLPVHIESLATQEPVSKQEADALKNLIGISKETINQNTEIQRFPMYVLSSGKVLIGNLSNCLDVLWDNFENVAKSDTKFYQRYQKYKSKWLESTGRNYLERIFPSESIYETLDYPNPDKEGITELDLAVKWGPFLLLVEAKAKQFRFESMRGDAGRLRTDLKENIEDAYEQAVRAIKYIHANKKAVFTERKTGRKLELFKNSVRKIYPVSLSLLLLGGVSTRLKETNELGLFKNGVFPFSICIADLDLITKANITPDIFLHYIEKRMEILNAREEWGGDEIDLFAAYLDCRLNISNLPIPSGEKIHYLLFSGYSDCFNRLAMYERGEIDVKPEISLSLPKPILDILQHLREWDDDSARWIAITLLNLEDKLLAQLASVIEEMKTMIIPPMVFRRYPFANEEVVITVIGSSTASLPELMDRLFLRATTEKYQRKLNKSIALGFICNGALKASTFEGACYIESEWEENKDLENLIANEPISLPLESTKMPGRNEPCICGSRKKYKKCCLRKIEGNLR
jgi:hypothetical protein